MSSPSPPPASAALRPWPLFLNFSALSLPISFTESTYRISQNLRFFLPNYAALTILVFLLTLLTRPLSLLLFISIFAAWVYLIFWRDEQLTVFNYDVDQKIVVGFLAVMTAIGVFWTGVWLRLLSALVIGGLIVVVHGVLRAPEDSMEDSPYGSLLNVVDSPRGDYSSV
ncbi:PRA1 (Prenylated rab acceptor) family protein [Striga asiatica]|uniref:PRA1 family protein n=1 Tax=Striga asiatica TaxID=4170 RepID=A0A5A7NYZ2_STRAF|nr:PRA1 (Prenylated rab acceptor) family protein [Striga asiatica]